MLCRKLSVAAAFAVMAAVLMSVLIGVTASADTVYSAVLLDLDDCIPDDREAELTEYMQKTAELIECNIGVVITADLKGKTDVQYSEGFLNDNFGRGSSSAVLMLLNTHDRPEYANYIDQISLDGRGHDYYNRYADKIFDSVYDGLDTSGFEEAVIDYCRALVRYAGSTGGYSVNETNGSFAMYIGALAIGLIMSLIITNIVSSKYKKKVPVSAANYLDVSRTTVTKRNDIFVREYTRSYSTSSSSGGSGGRGGHSSHGGSHRSGGHSSHGGRHR